MAGERKRFARIEAPSTTRLVAEDGAFFDASSLRAMIGSPGPVCGVSGSTASPGGLVDVIVDVNAAEFFLPGQCAPILLPAHVAREGDVDQLHFGHAAEQVVEELLRAPETRTCVVLDSSSMVVESVPGLPAGESLLLAPTLGRAMLIPEAEGLVEFVEALREPSPIATLLEDEDSGLIGALLGGLTSSGFAYRVNEEFPFKAEVHRYVAMAKWLGTVRRSIEIDLDAPGASATVLPSLHAARVTPQLTLKTAEPAAHKSLLEELARQRRGGRLAIHHVVVATTSSASAVEHVGDALLQLGAEIHVAPADGSGDWQPAAVSFSRLGLFVRPAVTVTRDFLLGDGLSALSTQIKEAGVAGPALSLGDDLSDDLLANLFEEVDELERRVGPFEWLDLPSVDEVLGTLLPRTGTLYERSMLGGVKATALRTHMQRVCAAVRQSELHLPLWPQSPQHEPLFLPPEEDYLPTSPAALNLHQGDRLVELCCGVGRVARRLEPLVGSSGTVIGFDLEPPLVERARTFAAERAAGHIYFFPADAQRIPLAAASADAVVAERLDAIWSAGLGPALIKEMGRIVRPGGRVAVSNVLFSFQLTSPNAPRKSTFPDLYQMMKDAFAEARLELVTERVWSSQMADRTGLPIDPWISRYLPRLVDDLDGQAFDGTARYVVVFLTCVGVRPL